MVSLFTSALTALSLLRLAACATGAVAEDPECRMMLVESIPTNLTYPPGSPTHPSTFDSWLWLLGNATSHVNIASFYWTLLNQDVIKTYCPTSKNGEMTMKVLLSMAHSKKVKLSVVNNGNHTTPDLQQIVDAGADVHLLDVTRLLGSGILHTKLWTVDDSHAYLGSANMDWRSLTEVKEMGVYFHQCPTLVNDLEKIQEAYRLLSGPNSTIPSMWPSHLSTEINMTSPLRMNVSGVPSEVYIGASPPQFSPPGRTIGMDAVTSVISNAKKFVYVAVMDYFPLIISYTGDTRNTFWPLFDDALRHAAIDRGVEVRLLISHWKHSDPKMWQFLKSINVISGTDVSIKVKSFKVPENVKIIIPFSRVNHNKYMVTDNTAYIGTSNWSGDYFIRTCGAGLVVKESKTSADGIRGQLQAVFERDWNSEYAHDLY